MSSEVLLLEKGDAIATLTLNRPDSMNALSSALRDAIADAFREIQADPVIRVAILTGAGRAFCAGFDLKELGQGDPERTIDGALRKAGSVDRRGRASEARGLRTHGAAKLPWRPSEIP
jgi:enoyl-CoA hydratase/carnithine racemase